MALTEEQSQIINSPASKIVVMSAAATGKTHTLIEKVRNILKTNIDPFKIVCITFTNNAAEEMRIRLGEDYKNGMFIGTIHKYANYLLECHGIDTQFFRDNEQFDELFKMVKKQPEVIRPVEFLALDEAQDSSKSQFEFIFDMIKPKSFIVFGDIRQSIYGFSGAKPQLLINLCKEKDIVVYEMNENHRSGKQIIDYANWVLKLMDNMSITPISCSRSTEGRIINITIENIVDLIQDNNDYANWVILCRANKRIPDIMNKLEEYNIPCVTFKQADGDLNELREKMKANAVKVLTIHSAKGLEWPKVIIADRMGRGRTAEEREEEKRIRYVAVTRARDELYFVK